jgi:hypothetical protein
MDTIDFFSGEYDRTQKMFNDDDHNNIINKIQDIELKALNAANNFDGTKAVESARSDKIREEFTSILESMATQTEEQKEASWVDVIAKFPKSFWLNIKHSGMSVGKVLTDVADFMIDPRDFARDIERKNILGEELFKKVSLREGDTLAASSIEQTQDIRENLQETAEYVPQNLKGAKWLVFNGSMMLARQMPIIAAAALTGGATAPTSLASALTSFSGAAFTMSGMEAVDKYGELSAQGVDPRRAMVVSSLYGAISYYAEKIPISRMLDPTTNKGFKDLMINMVGEVAAENITELGHMAVDMGLMDESYSVGDLLRRFKDTTVLTVLTAPAMQFGARKFQKIGDDFRVKMNYANVLSEMEQYNRDYQRLDVVGDIGMGETITPETDMEISEIVETPEGETAFEYKQPIKIQAFENTPEGIILNRTIDKVPNLEDISPDIIEKIRNIKTNLEQPEISVEDKQTDFMNGKFTISMASDISSDQVDVLLDMDKGILTINDLANIDLPDYITPELVDKARENVVRELTNRGVTDIDNHPKMNLLDNIDKRLSMRPRDVIRYRAENHKTVDEHISDISDINDRMGIIKVETQTLVSRMADADIKLKAIENDDTQVERFNKLIEKRNKLADKINNNVDELVSGRRKIRNITNTMEKSRYIDISKDVQMRLKKSMETVKSDIDQINDYIDVADIVNELDPETSQQILDADSSENVWRDKSALITDMLRNIDKQRQIAKNATKKVDAYKKQNARRKIERITEQTNKITEAFKFDSNRISDLLTDNVLEDTDRDMLTKRLDALVNTYSEIVDRLDYINENIFDSADSVVMDDIISKLRNTMTQYNLEIKNTIDTINELDIKPDTKFNINYDIMNSKPEFRSKTKFEQVFDRMGIDLQFFASSNKTDKQISKYIDNLRKKAVTRASELNIPFENINNFIDMYRDSIKLNVKDIDGTYDTVAVQQPKKHFFNPIQKFFNNFKQIYHIKNDILQEYVKGVDMTKIEKSKVENESLKIGAQFLKLNSDEQTMLLENFMIPSTRMNKRFNKSEFKAIHKKLNIKQDVDKMYQAYEAYGNMQDFLVDKLVEKLTVRDEGLAKILDKNRSKYYVPLRRKPGVGYVTVVSKQDSDYVYYYREASSKKDMQKIVQDIKTGKQKVFRDYRDSKGNIVMGEEIDLSTRENDFEIIAKMHDDNRILSNIMLDMLGIFPDETSFNKTEFEKYMQLSDDLSTAVDNAVTGAIVHKDSDNPDALSRRIKNNLNKLYQKRNAIGGFFMAKKGIAGYDAKTVMDEISNAVNKSVSAVSRFDLLEFHQGFMEQYGKNIPNDIKQYIKDYYRANVDKPDVMNQLAAKLSYANILYHIGANGTTVLKNYLSAPLLIELEAGDTGLYAHEVAKIQLETAPKIVRFTKEYVKYLMSDKDILFGNISHGDKVDKLTEMAEKSGFTPDEVNLITEAFDNNFVDAGIATEFQRMFALNDSNFNNVSNLMMVPFKISEIGVRLHSLVSFSRSMLKGKGQEGQTLNDYLYDSYLLTNKVQPSGGAYGRITAANRKGVVGAATRVSTSLMGFLFNAGLTAIDQASKSSTEIKNALTGKGVSLKHSSGIAAFALGTIMLGGMRSLPYSDELRKIYRSLSGGIDPITLMDNGDSEIGNFIANGVMKYMHIDIPGLAWGVPITTDLLKGGATGSMVYRIAKGTTGAIKSGFDGNWYDMYKNTEYAMPTMVKRLMRAARLATYGYDTQSGIMLTDETGAVKKMSPSEAILSLTGLQARTKNYTDYKLKRVKNEIKANYNASKQSVVQGIRRAIQMGNYDKANKYMNDFNSKLKWYYNKYKEVPVSPITRVTIRKVDE